MFTGIIIGTIGSLGRMDYNIPLFAFELIREKFFNNAYYGFDVKYTDEKEGLWLKDWAEIKAQPVLYSNLQRENYFKLHSWGLLAFSCLVDVWWFFYVVWYIWASDEWKALASWENTFHWISFSCGALCFLLKLAFFFYQLSKTISEECEKQQGCAGWCSAFWCCKLSTESDDFMFWPNYVKPAEPKAPAPVKK